MDERLKRALLVILKHISEPIRAKYPEQAPWEWDEGEDKRDIIAIMDAEDFLEENHAYTRTVEDSRGTRRPHRLPH